MKANIIIRDETNNLNENNNIDNNKNNELKSKLKKDGKSYYLKRLEFINNICENCKESSLKNIYKCVICDNYFLCEKCYKINNKHKFHSHDDFFEIHFPSGVKKQIKEENKPSINVNITIEKYNKLLQEYFFDENGELLLNEKKQIDLRILKTICKEMKNFKNDPIDYFANYKICFLEKPKKELKDKQLDFVQKKMEAIFVNLSNILKDQQTNEKKTQNNFIMPHP